MEEMLINRAAKSINLLGGSNMKTAAYLHLSIDVDLKYLTRV